MRLTTLSVELLVPGIGVSSVHNVLALPESYCRDGYATERCSVLEPN